MKNRNKIAILLLLTLGFQSLILQAEDNTEEMKKLYDKGVTLFDQGKYQEAAKAFRELVEGRPRFQYYYNIAECEYLRKRIDLAKEAFDIYLEKVGDKADPMRRAHAEDVNREITPLLGYLNVEETASVEVWVDNEHRSNTPIIKPIAVMSGERTVVLKKDGELVFETKIVAEQMKTLTVKRDKGQPEKEEPTHPQETVSVPETTPEEMITVTEPRSSSPLKYVGIAMTNLGGMMLIAGTITGGLAISKSNQLSENCPIKDQCEESNKSHKEKGQALKSATIGLLSAGAVFATTGMIMTIAGHRKNKSTRESLSALPLTDGTMVGISVHGRF